MPQVNRARPRREDGSPSNWDRYLDLLIRRQVPAKFRQWYVRRVEDFLKDLKPTALSASTAEQVTDDLQRMSTRSDLADWQTRQIVDALRLLLVDLAQVPPGKGSIGTIGGRGQRTLPPEHATIARSTAMNAEDGADPRAIGVPRFRRSAQTFPILEDLARTIRAMQYSIRTEQSYVDWCHRFLLFCGSKPLDALGVPDVQRFLSHLAVERSVLGQDAESGVQRGGVSVQAPLGASAGGRAVLEDQEAGTAPRGLESRRDAGAVGAHERHVRTDGSADVRHRDAVDGVRTAAGVGCPLRQRFDPGAQRQGRQGPGGALAAAAAPMC